MHLRLFNYIINCILIIIFHTIIAVLRSHRVLALEKLALRYQLNDLQ